MLWKKNIVCEDFQKGIYYISSWVTKEQYDDLIGQYYDVLKIGKSGCSDIVDSNYAKRNTYVQIVHWHMVKKLLLHLLSKLLLIKNSSRQIKANFTTIDNDQSNEMFKNFTEINFDILRRICPRQGSRRTTPRVWWVYGDWVMSLRFRLFCRGCYCNWL